ncbi:MAG: hypothetical protein ACKVOM_01085 [Ferruginibacter sp.]
MLELLKWNPVFVNLKTVNISINEMLVTKNVCCFQIGKEEDVVLCIINFIKKNEEENIVSNIPTGKYRNVFRDKELAFENNFEKKAGSFCLL